MSVSPTSPKSIHTLSHPDETCVYFRIILYVNCFGRTVLYMCIEYHIEVNMYHVRAQGVEKSTINIHYYYYYCLIPLAYRTLFSAFARISLCPKPTTREEY